MVAGIKRTPDHTRVSVSLTFVPSVTKISQVDSIHVLFSCTVYADRHDAQALKSNKYIIAQYHAGSEAACWKHLTNRQLHRASDTSSRQ